VFMCLCPYVSIVCEIVSLRIVYIVLYGIVLYMCVGNCEPVIVNLCV